MKERLSYEDVCAEAAHEQCDCPLLTNYTSGSTSYHMQRHSEILAYARTLHTLSRYTRHSALTMQQQNCDPRGVSTTRKNIADSVEHLEIGGHICETVIQPLKRLLR